MEQDKKDRLEKSGWAVGTVDDFLDGFTCAYCNKRTPTTMASLCTYCSDEKVVRRHYACKKCTHKLNLAEEEICPEIDEISPYEALD